MASRKARSTTPDSTGESGSPERVGEVEQEIIGGFSGLDGAKSTIIEGYDTFDPTLHPNSNGETILEFGEDGGPANAASGDTANGGTSGPKRKGRPPGSKNRVQDTTRKVTQIAKTLGTIENLLISIHSGLAFWVPEMELDQKEAKAIATAVGDLAEYYPVNVNPKAIAWAGLLAELGKIYGTRAYAFYQRKKLEEKKVPTPIDIAKPTVVPKQQPQRPSKPINEMSPSEFSNEPPRDGTGI
jgi:hypothetical protein